MKKFNPFKIFRKRRIESTMKDYLILSKKDIERLLNGGTITFEIEKYLPEIVVSTEEHYEHLMSEVKRYNYDLR